MHCFFFNDTATTEIYTLFPTRRSSDLQLDSGPGGCAQRRDAQPRTEHVVQVLLLGADRKSTRLNSSHPSISYAVFCLKKKKYDYVERCIECDFDGSFFMRHVFLLHFAI